MESSGILYKKDYEIFADYHQFYLMDAEVYPDAPVEYTEEDVHRRIKASKNIVVIQPERSMTVPVEFEVVDVPPSDNFENWHHVAEGSLDLPSGRLLIEECTGNEPIDEIELSPGSYRIRAYFSGLDTLSWNGLDGDDRYKIVMWRAPFEAIGILKQYEVGGGS